MAGSRRERILILCKTYPSPSGRHAETSCVAGMTDDGRLIRLFPVPFRLIGDKQQFRKWQWIRAQIYKANDDHRRESHKVYVDTIALDGAPVPTTGRWSARRSLLASLPVHDDFADLEAARVSDGATLGLVRPSRLVGLDVTPVANADWTAEELEKLVRRQQQGGLFDAEDARQIRTLRKLPFSFHYNYECEMGGRVHAYRHKIVDWEAGALFWRMRREHGAGWERPFREKLEGGMAFRDLRFLMGTIHRFPDQWLIVSLIYPPKVEDLPARQTELAL